MLGATMGTLKLGPCIYCGQPADGKEHWLPASLGGVDGDVTLIDRLCTDCNTELGRTVDQEFSRTGLVGYMRAAHEIQGRSDGGPGPFYYKAASATPPTQLKIPSPDGSYEVLAQARRDPARHGEFVASAIRQIIFKRADATIDQLAFPRAWTANILRQAIAQHGLKDAAPFELYLDDDETPDSKHVKDVLYAAIPSMPSVKCWFGGNSEAVIRQRGEMRAGISVAYIRAIAKLGFHYFLRFSNLYRGSEPEFAAVRSFIRNGTGSWRNFVQLVSPPFVPQLQTMRPARPMHFIMSRVDEQVALAGVHLFVAPNMPPASLVRLGRSPRRTIGPPLLSAHQVRYLTPEEAAGGHVAKLESIDVTERRIIPVRLRVVHNVR